MVLNPIALDLRPQRHERRIKNNASAIVFPVRPKLFDSALEAGATGFGLGVDCRRHGRFSPRGRILDDPARVGSSFDRYSAGQALAPAFHILGRTTLAERDRKRLVFRKGLRASGFASRLWKARSAQARRTRLDGRSVYVAMSRKRMEASPGIEPGCKDLQSSA